MPRLHSRTIALNRVVITGMGTVNPLGNDVSTSWNALLKGVSGIAPLVGFETEDLAVRFGGPGEGLRSRDRARQEGGAPLRPRAAVRDGAPPSRPWPTRAGRSRAERADRTGVLIGSGIAGLQTMYDNCEALANRGPRKVSPFFVPYAIANMSSGIVSMRFGARGPNSCVVTACTTGHARDRRRVPDPAARRRRRDDRRRRRGVGEPARCRRLRQHARALARATTTRSARVARSTAAATAS